MLNGNSTRMIHLTQTFPFYTPKKKKIRKMDLTLVNVVILFKIYPFVPNAPFLFPLTDLVTFTEEIFNGKLHICVVKCI